MNKALCLLAVVLCGCSSINYAIVGDSDGEDTAFDYLKKDAAVSAEIEADSFLGDQNKIALDKYDAKIKYNNFILALNFLQNDVQNSHRSGIVRGVNNYFISPLCFGLDVITLDLFNAYDEDEIKAKEKSWKFVYETNANWYDIKYEYFKYGNVMDANGNLVEDAVARRDAALAKIHERRSEILSLIVDLSNSTHSIDASKSSLYKEQADGGNSLVDVIKEYAKEFAQENANVK